MKGETYILVTGLLTALANLPEVQSQDECAFFGENLTGNQITVNIAETIPSNQVILSLTTSEGYTNCSDLSSVGFSKYIGYSHTENTKLEFFMAQAIGDDLDDGDISIVIQVIIEPENTKQPIFSQNSTSLSLEENYPIELDFSDRLMFDGQRLNVFDMDLPLEELMFDVSDRRFKALEPRLRYYNDSKNQLRVEYEPCIAVNTPLNAVDSPITFDLIAMNDPKESLFSITINILPNDLRDPEFESPYYTSLIPYSEFTGFLTVEPQNILAYDGDIKIDKEIRYEIADNGGLDADIKNKQPGKRIPIEIELSQPVEGSATDKMRYIVVKAIQTDDINRTETVVLAVELGQTITTSTSMAPTTISTCPPCLTSSTSEQTTTPSAIPCTTPSELICPTCPTTTATTTITSCPICPTSSPIPCTTPSELTCPTCPTVAATTAITTCPICPSTPDTAHTTTLFTTTSSSTSPSISVTTGSTISTAITSTAASILSTTTDGTPDNSYPACPIPTSCPTTCPELTTLSTSTSEHPTTPTCNCDATTSTTTQSGVTCLTTSQPLGEMVHFDKQQYASEVVENTPVRTVVVTLSATSTSANEQPAYSFVEGYDNKYFTVDAKTGVVTTTQSLPIGDYSVEAIAEIPSGAKDYARVIVSAVMGTLCSGTQFSSPLYEFPVAERTTGIIGQVELRSTEDTKYNLIITSCNPPSMISDFEVKPDGTLVVVKSFNWTVTLSKITITITAISQTTPRTTSISTIVNLDVLDINDAPEFIGSTLYVVVGYPERTYFDPSVRMPLFTTKAFDSDSKENASLTYHLADQFEIFDIDALGGSLYARGLDSLGPTSSRTVQVFVRDKHGLQDTLNITVKSLGDEFIILMKAKSDTDTLTEETIASEMSDILGYQVVVLRLEKGPDSEVSLRSGYAYKVILYAIDRTAFVCREDFTKKVDQVDTTGLSWTIDGSLSAPLEYEVERIIDKLSKEAQGYEIATVVLATLLGVTLSFIIAYTLYVHVNKIEMKRPWSRAFQAASLEIDKKHWDQRSFVHSDDLDDEQASATPTVSYSSALSGVSNAREAAPPTIRFVAGKTFGDDVQSSQSPAEDDAYYCPPTPVPKKSILKDPNAMDKNNKQRMEGDSKLDDANAGVKFNSTPEVIKVAATAPGPPVKEVDLPNNNNQFDDDDDDDFLVEEF